MMTLAGGSSRSSQGGSPGPESDHTSESGGLRLWSGSSSPPPADEQWPDIHTPPPSNPEIAAAPVSSNMNRDQQPASSWVSDPNRASLRRRVGISANLDKQTQERMSRDFRRDVRQLAGIDFSKTWTQLESEGRTEDMINSILPYHFPTLSS